MAGCDSRLLSRLKLAFDESNGVPLWCARAVKFDDLAVRKQTAITASGYW